MRRTAPENGREGKSGFPFSVPPFLLFQFTHVSGVFRAGMEKLRREELKTANGFSP
jgi:hypothetical protein